jgi:hypothetical protein
MKVGTLDVVLRPSSEISVQKYAHSKVFLGANQAFFMWFELIHFNQTGKILSFVSMYCTIKNNQMYNLVYHMLDTHKLLQTNLFAFLKEKINKK